MKKIMKRVTAFFLAWLIIVTSVFGTYDKAYATGAAGIIGGGTVAAVGTEYAFAYLLGALGLTAASAAVYENADSIKAWGAEQIGKFKAWVSGNVAEEDDDVEGEIIDFNERLQRGTLNKLSKGWKWFKNWISHIYARKTGIDNSGSLEIPDGFSCVIIPDRYKDGELTYNTRLFDSATASIDRFVLETRYSIYSVFYAYDSSGRKIGAIDALRSGRIKGGFQGALEHLFKYLSGDSDSTFTRSVWSVDVCSEFLSGEVSSSYYSPYDFYDKDGTLLFPANVGNNTGASTYAPVGGIEYALDSDKSLEHIDIVPEIETTTSDEVPIVFPSSDVLADLLMKLGTGVATWEDVVADTGIKVVDKSNPEKDYIINNEGLTDIPYEPVPNGPVHPSPPSEIKDYTIGGLEKLFPFCLPFDLVDFIQILDAQPETPRFTVSIPYMTTRGMQTYQLDIDLSPFDSVAELLRDMECLLFIIGLIMVTREKMIRGVGYAYVVCGDDVFVCFDACAGSSGVSVSAVYRGIWKFSVFGCFELVPSCRCIC